MVVMPLFSSDLDIPFASKFPRLLSLQNTFNDWFGRGKSHSPLGDNLRRDAAVFLVLVAVSLIAAFSVGAPLAFAAPIAAISGVVTVLMRLAKREWHAWHNPTGLAEEILDLVKPDGEECPLIRRPSPMTRQLGGSAYRFQDTFAHESRVNMIRYQDDNKLSSGSSLSFLPPPPQDCGSGSRQPSVAEGGTASCPGFLPCPPCPIL
jgi:hypothetical protein